MNHVNIYVGVANLSVWALTGIVKKYDNLARGESEGEIIVCVEM